MTTMTRAEHAKRQVELAEGLLEDMARKRAASTGEGYEVAYAKALKTPRDARCTPRSTSTGPTTSGAASVACRGPRADRQERRGAGQGADR